MSNVAAIPELGDRVNAAGIVTNLHDVGVGEPVLLLHGSGPGVTAWANWRLTIPELSKQHRVIAPDLVGFGYTERPAQAEYSLDSWVNHSLGIMDSLGIQKFSVVGNSFGGAIALALAIRHPDRVKRMVLMGSVGVPFLITPELDAIWGYQPSMTNMRTLLDIFAHDRGLVSDELAELRFQASIRPGYQESYEKMFPAPRHRWVDALSSSYAEISSINAQTLIIHGRDDRVIPLENALLLNRLIKNSQMHIFGNCGHWTQIECTKDFNQLVKNFLS